MREQDNEWSLDFTLPIMALLKSTGNETAAYLKAREICHSNRLLESCLNACNGSMEIEIIRLGLRAWDKTCQGLEEIRDELPCWKKQGYVITDSCSSHTTRLRNSMEFFARNVSMSSLPRVCSNFDEFSNCFIEAYGRFCGHSSLKLTEKMFEANKEAMFKMVRLKFSRQYTIPDACTGTIIRRDADSSDISLSILSFPFKLAILSNFDAMTEENGNKIGYIGAISYTAGTIIGSGIFVSPKGILTHAGSIGLSLAIWVGSAVIAMLSGLVFVELATSIPESGSDFAYINFVKWKPLAFAFLWLSNLVEASCSCAILFYTFGEYMVEALDPLNLDLSSTKRHRLEQLFGFALLWILMWANFFSLKRWASKIQIGITIAKLFSVSIIIVTGFYFLFFKGKSDSFESSKVWKNTQSKPGEIVLAIYSGIWAYAGYDTLNYGTEDVDPKKLKKIMPMAVIGGLTIATIVYILANIAYFAVLLPDEILDSNAVATTFSKKTLGNFYYAMPAIVAILMIGTINSDIFSWSRFIVSGARAGMMPRFLSLIHIENESPRTGILFHVFAAIIFSFIGPIDTLMNYLFVTGMLRQAVTVAALIYIRLKKIPVSSSALRLPIFIPVLVFVISIALVAVPAFQDLLATGVGVGMLIVFLFAYFLVIWPNYDWSFLRKIDESFTQFCQKLFVSVIDEGPKIVYGNANENEKSKL
ncbi:unnamed protein product, partial [Mesorhabditis belari]|uniref:Amino acid transporter n=1 Tax=Mesorhabditis belari TaxID=2138241 RepID=A0AAF3F184_9BILA